MPLKSQMHKISAYLVWPLAGQGEDLPFLSPHKSSIDVYDTSSSPRPKLWCYIIPLVSLRERFVQPIGRQTDNSANIQDPCISWLKNAQIGARTADFMENYTLKNTDIKWSS